MKQTKKALKQSLSLTLRTVPNLSKAGELGITEAYEVLKRYASLDN